MGIKQRRSDQGNVRSSPAGITREWYRIIDANVNRAKEGLRVCEDVCRFVLDAKTETAQLKRIRHAITDAVACIDRRALLQSRDTQADVGKGSIGPELTRTTVTDIFYANIQRAKESVRVLEECIKIVDQQSAEHMKKQRYALYILEKKISPRL